MKKRNFTSSKFTTYFVTGLLAISISACNKEAVDEITEQGNFTTDEISTEDAETASRTNPVDLSQLQTSSHGHGRLGYRQPGYVNQDAYIAGNIYEVDNLAYYGDWDSNRIYIIDVDNMQLLTTVEGTGAGPYGIDQQGNNKAYALTRLTDSLTIVDNYTLENKGFIDLRFIIY